MKKIHIEEDFAFLKVIFQYSNSVLRVLTLYFIVMFVIICIIHKLVCFYSLKPHQPFISVFI